MTDELLIWDKINYDIKVPNSIETYDKVNVYKLTEHLSELYDKIDDMLIRIRDLENEKDWLWNKVGELEND